MQQEILIFSLGRSSLAVTKVERQVQVTCEGVLLLVVVTRQVLQVNGAAGSTYM